MWIGSCQWSFGLPPTPASAKGSELESVRLKCHIEGDLGHSQERLCELEPKSDRIQTALAYAKQNLHTALTVSELAEAAHLSPRQFSRAFHAEIGQSPAKAIENLRVETTLLMMEQSRPRQ